MKITLRERLKGDKIVLYLDYYQRGFRKTEYLDIFLTPQPEKGKLTRLEADRNKENRQLAEQICHQKNLYFNSGKFSFTDIKRQKSLILPYFEQLANDRNTSKGNGGNWDSMLKHFKNYCHPGYTFENINVAFLEGFKNHLNLVQKSNEKSLSQNSKISYFNKLLAGLRQAHKDGLLLKNPSESVAGYKQVETKREYLTMEELESIAQTDCELPILKRAFLFSCLTGLRFGDLHKLIWDDLIESESLGSVIRFRQSKTKSLENLPITDQARNILGERDEVTYPLFPRLHYSAWNNLKLDQWMKDAGIRRKITFHAARHTHAVLQLSLGTDIFTVSKMLGHKSLKTTQIYAKVMDKTKRTAANKLIIKNLDGKEGQD